MTQVAGQEKEETSPSIFVARTRISLARELREGIKSGTGQDNRWAEIISQLESGQIKEIQIGGRSFRLSGGLLEVRNSESKRKAQWQLVVPDDPEIKKQIMRELHEVPYSGHLGYHKMLQIFSVLFTGPSTPWIFVILSRGAQCARKKKPSIEYQQGCSNL